MRLRIGAHCVSLLRRSEGGPKGGLDLSVTPKGLNLRYKIKDLVPRREPVGSIQALRMKQQTSTVRSPTPTITPTEQIGKYLAKWQD